MTVLYSLLFLSPSSTSSPPFSYSLLFSSLLFSSLLFSALIFSPLLFYSVLFLSSLISAPLYSLLSPLLSSLSPLFCSSLFSLLFSLLSSYLPTEVRQTDSRYANASSVRFKLCNGKSTRVASAYLRVCNRYFPIAFEFESAVLFPAKF